MEAGYRAPDAGQTEPVLLLHGSLSSGVFGVAIARFWKGTATALSPPDPTRVASLTLIEPAAFSVLRDAGETAAYTEVAGIRDAYLAECGRGHHEAAVRGFVNYWMGAGVRAGLPKSGKAEILRVAAKTSRSGRRLTTVGSCTNVCP